MSAQTAPPVGAARRLPAAVLASLPARPPLCWVYQCRRCRDTTESEEHTQQRVDQYITRLKASQADAGLVRADTIKDDGDWSGSRPHVSVSILERPVGAELNRLLMPGDHVVFARTERGRVNLASLLRLVDLWRSRGVTVHLADLGLDLGRPEHREAFRLAVSLVMDWNPASHGLA